MTLIVESVIRINAKYYKLSPTAWTRGVPPAALALAKYSPKVGTFAATSIQKNVGICSTKAAWDASVESVILRNY